MEVPTPTLLALVAVVVATVLMTIREWVRQRREAAVSAEVQRQAHRRIMPLGSRHSSDEWAQPALVQPPPGAPGLFRVLWPLLVGGTAIAVMAVFALLSSSPDGAGSSAPAASSTTIAAAMEPSLPLGTVAGPPPEPTTTTPSPTSASAEPPPAPTEAPVIPNEAFVIANTEGLGVWLRSACRDDARTNEAWNEGQLVDAVLTEQTDCSGWRLVEAAGVQSWVDERYLQPLPVSSGP